MKLFLTIAAVLASGVAGYFLGKQKQAEHDRKFGTSRRNESSDKDASEIVGNLGYQVAHDPYWKA